MKESRNEVDRALDEQLGFLIAEYKLKAIDVHEFVRLVDIMYSDFLDFHPELKERAYVKFHPRRSITAVDDAKKV